MEVISNQNISLPKSPFQIQQHFNHVSMVNLLQGMTSLARFADSLFTSIAKETNETFQRIDKLSHRVERAQEESAVAHETILQLSLAKMLENYKAKFTVEKVVPKLVVHPSTRPFVIEEAYNKAQVPPNLKKLQSLTEDGQDPSRFFSDPDYFYEDWRQQEKKRQEVRKQRRKQNFLERRPRRRPAVIQKYQYDPLTGVRILRQELKCTAEVEIQIPLPSFEVVILDEEASIHPPAEARPKPGENRNDIELPPPAVISPLPDIRPARPMYYLPASLQPPTLSSFVSIAPPPPPPTDPIYNPPPAAYFVPPPPLLPENPNEPVDPARADPRTALLDAIRRGPTGILRHPVVNPVSIRNNRDKSLLVNIIREKIDGIRDAWTSGEESEPDYYEEWD